MNSPHSFTLRREFSLLDAVMVGLGAIMGAGIFVVTGVAAHVAGPAFILGLLIAAMAAACNALSSAQLAARYPTSGGTYEYGYEVLHPWAGFAAGWMFLASKISAGGVVALGFGSYLAVLFPSVSPTVAAVGAVAVLTAANYFGIKKAGRLNTAIVAITLVALTVFVITGIPSFEFSRMAPFAPNGVGSVFESAALLFFAYTGYARIATLAEEVREPERTIPRAIIFSLSISTVLYLAVSLVAVGAVGADALGSSRSPLEIASKSFGFTHVTTILGVGATTAMLGVLLSQVLGISRMMLAMARRSDFPKAFSTIHPLYSVPYNGVILTGSLICVLAVFGTLEWVVSAATFTILLYYGITNIAALKLDREYRIYPSWIPCLGFVSCCLLGVSLKQQTIIAGLSVLALGFLLRFCLRTLTRK